MNQITQSTTVSESTPLNFPNLPTVYTLVSYTPGEEGWHDRCGDYHKGKESECSVLTFMSKEATGEAMGISRFNNSDTEFTVLINGLNEDSYHDFLSDEQQKDLEWECSQIRDISYEKHEELKKIKVQKDLEDKIKKEQAEEIKKQQEKERIEANERAQLAQLKAKYKM